MTDGEEVTMRILDDAMDQCLLCVGGGGTDDSPRGREAALRRLEPGIRAKEVWRYHNTSRGLRTLVAYVGSTPAGEIEFIPIERAPAPIDGERLLVVDCLHVAPRFQHQGIGSALLSEAERMAHESGRGVAVVASSEGPAMPPGFFLRRGYHRAAMRGSEVLLVKSFPDDLPPAFLPRRPPPSPAPGLVSIDVFACGQCPRDIWTLDRITTALRRRPGTILRVFDTSERAAIRRWGVASQALVNGEPVARRPADPGTVLAMVDRAAALRDAGRGAAA
jgi:GNAT superfamily N-acetyltransferase